MTKDDIIRKLTSRKFWVAVAGFVSGVILAVRADESLAQTVSGLILQGASILGYMLAEGLTDVAAIKAEAIDGYIIDADKLNPIVVETGIESKDVNK